MSELSPELAEQVFTRGRPSLIPDPDHEGAYLPSAGSSITKHPTVPGAFSMGRYGSLNLDYAAAETYFIGVN